MIPNSIRLLSQGDIPNSAAGIFNPGAVLFNGKIVIAVRKEQSENYLLGKMFASPVHPTIVIQNPDTDAVEEIFTLEPTGFDVVSEKYRLEDFRLFIFNSALYCNHVFLHEKADGIIAIKQAISIVDLKNRLLKFWIEPILPIALRRIEKNWVYFEWEEQLMCLYSTSPMRSFVKVKDENRWLPFGNNTSMLQWLPNQPIRNGCNPIWVDNMLLKWFHSMDPKTLIYHNSPALFGPVEGHCGHWPQPLLSGGRADGYKPGVLYVSSCVYLPARNILRAYFGEGDSHTSYIDFDKNKLMAGLVEEKATSDLKQMKTDE